MTARNWLLGRTSHTARDALRRGKQFTVAAATVGHSLPPSDALTGRRSRRFFRGAEIPDGHFKFASRHKPLPLSELEEMILLTAIGGNTGWNYLIMHNARYAPHLPNYAGAAGGRTFPSAAGFHTSEVFFTDDDGVYLLETREAPALAGKAEGGDIDLGVHFS